MRPSVPELPDGVVHRLPHRLKLTPYPGGGLDRFDPVLDRVLGYWWELPSSTSSTS